MTTTPPPMEKQPSIREIVEKYLDPEDMPGGLAAYRDMLDELMNRDYAQAGDSFRLGQRSAFREIRQHAQTFIDKFE